MPKKEPKPKKDIKVKGQWLLRRHQIPSKLHYQYIARSHQITHYMLGSDVLRQNGPT